MRTTLLVWATLLFLTCGRAETASPAWQQVWKSEAVLRSIALEGEARTTALVAAKPRTARAKVRAAGGKVRLDYEVGEHQWSLIDDGQCLIRLDPKRKHALSRPRPPFGVDRELAERNYRARLVREETVAGRPVRVIEIAPCQGGAVAWRLWLDEDNGFALRREHYDVEGRLTIGTEYLAVKYGATIPTDTFTIPPDWKRVTFDGGEALISLSALKKRLSFTLHLPHYLPRGYVLMGGGVQRRRGGQEIAELRYTDGLCIMSVFQHPRPGPDRPPGPRRGNGPGRRPGGPPRPGAGPPPPPRELLTITDRGPEKVLRFLGKERMIVVVGNLTKSDLALVAHSTN